MKDQPPPSGRHPRRGLVKAHVLVTVEYLAAPGEDFDIDCLLAVEEAVRGVDVPGTTVLRVSVAPNDGGRMTTHARGTGP